MAGVLGSERSFEDIFFFLQLIAVRINHFHSLFHSFNVHTWVCCDVYFTEFQTFLASFVLRNRFFIKYHTEIEEIFWIFLLFCCAPWGFCFVLLFLFPSDYADHFSNSIYFDRILIISWMIIIYWAESRRRRKKRHFWEREYLNKFEIMLKFE